MKKIAILSLVLAAGAAMAAEPASYDPSTTGSVATRAAVQAEFTQAFKGGMLPQTGEVGPVAVQSDTGAARDVGTVRAEARQATASYLTFGEV
jgi:hypothetical protein